MARTLTIQLPDDATTTLEEIGRRQHRTVEDVAQDILNRTLVVARLRQLQQQLRPQADAAGFRGEDDILQAISCMCR